MSTQPRASRPRGRLPESASLPPGPPGTYIVRHVDDNWHTGAALVPAASSAEALSIFRRLHPSYRIIGGVEDRNRDVPTCDRCGAAHRGWLGRGPGSGGHKFEQRAA